MNTHDEADTRARRIESPALAGRAGGRTVPRFGVRSFVRGVSSRAARAAMGCLPITS
jgi:hypothetical protein